MNGTNWFNAAAAPGGGVGANLGASSSSLFGNSSSFNNNNNPQQPGGGLFGNSSTNNNTNLNGSALFGGLNNNNNNNTTLPNSPSSAAFGGQARNGAANQSQDIPATEYNENQRLQNKYLESFTPGGNKKKGAGATKTTSSPTGGPMGAFTEPSRFGSNSLYGSGAGVSPNKSSHRLSNNNTTSTNRDTSQSTSSPLGNSSMSVRSRMSTGGSASEERPGQGYSHSYGYTGYGGGAGGGMGEDPERPPVRSYADDDGADLNQQTTQGQGQGMGGGMEDEDGMRYDDDTDGPTHMLMVYGLPPSKQDRLQSFLSQFGTLTHFQVGPMDSNYIVVAFDDPSVALRLQRQSGEVRMDGWYLGFRGLSEGAVPEAWSRSKSGGGGQLEVRRNGEGNHGHAESHAMDLRSAPSITTTAVSTNNNKTSDDPFASISTLTPIKSGGSVFRPTASSASSGQQQQQQQKVDPRFAFGTGQQQQQQQQQQQTGQQTQGGGGYGFFGKISDVMFGH